jgi:hypothetical protein
MSSLTNASGSGFGSDHLLAQPRNSKGPLPATRQLLESRFRAPGGHYQKGGRPEAALSLGRKRPRRAYTGVNPHRNNLMLRCSNCKRAFTAVARSRPGAAGRWNGSHYAVRAIPKTSLIAQLRVPGDCRVKLATLRAGDSRAIVLRLRRRLRRPVPSPLRSRTL